MLFSGVIIDNYKKTAFSRHDADGSIFYFSADDFPGLKKEEFSFKNQNGESLFGAFYYYDGYREDRLIVFDHGMGTGHNAYMKEIGELCKGGFRVFSYDHTGCTLSEGEGIRGLSGSLADLDACIKALKEKLPGVEISVVGHSWGAFSTLNISSFNPDIRSIVAISGFISLSEMHRQVIRGPLAIFRKTVFEYEKGQNGKYAEASADRSLRGARTPALIIHSIDDKTVSAKQHFEKLRQSLSDCDFVEFMLVEGKGHNPNYTAEAVAYKDRFLADLMKRRKRGLLQTDEQKAAFLNSYDWHKMTEQDAAVWDKILDFLNKN